MKCAPNDKKISERKCSGTFFVRVECYSYEINFVWDPLPSSYTASGCRTYNYRELSFHSKITHRFSRIFIPGTPPTHPRSLFQHTILYKNTLSLLVLSSNMVRGFHLCQIKFTGNERWIMWYVRTQDQGSRDMVKGKWKAARRGENPFHAKHRTSTRKQGGSLPWREIFFRFAANRTLSNRHFFHYFPPLSLSLSLSLWVLCIRKSIL